MKLYKIIIIFVISIIISFFLTPIIEDIFNIYKYKVSLLYNNIQFIYTDKFVDKHKDYTLLITTAHIRNGKKLKFKLFDENMDIYRIQYTDINWEQVKNNDMYVEDFDNDSLKELYYFYVENDSLYVIQVDFRNMGEKNLFNKILIDSKQNDRYKDVVRGRDMIIRDVNGDGYKDLIVLVETFFTMPRGIIVYDIHNDSIIKRDYTACSPHDIKYAKNRFLALYRGPHNGVYFNNEMDTKCKLKIYADNFDDLYEFSFEGYSLFNASIDTFNNEMTLFLFSHFNRRKYPSKIVTLNFITGEIINEKYIGDVITVRKSYLIDEAHTKGRVVGIDKNSNIYIYDRLGNIVKRITSITKDVPNTNTVRLLGIFYSSIFNKTLFIVYSDKSYLYDLNGKRIFTCKPLLSIAESQGKLKVSNKESSVFDYYTIEKDKNYNLKHISLIMIVFSVGGTLLFLLIIFVRYLWLSYLYRFVSLSSMKSVFILLNNKIIQKNKSADVFIAHKKDIVSKIIELEYYKQKTFFIDNEYFQCEYFYKNIFGLNFRIIVIDNITKDMELNRLRANFDKIALLNHNIKNAVTSLLAKKDTILYKEKEIPPMMLDFFNKIDNTVKNILETSESVMKLSIGSIEYNILDVQKIKDFVLQKYKIELKFNVKDNIKTIYTDWTLLKYVIENIIDNAIHEIDRLPNKYIEINIYKKDDESIIIDIFNNGSSVEEEVVDKILSGGYTTKPYGSGYGVFISKNIMNILNGDLIFVKGITNGVLVRLKFNVEKIKS